MGAGTVVCCVVVVELWVPLLVPQPVTDIKATAATQARISFTFSIILLVCLVTLQESNYASGMTSDYGVLPYHACGILKATDAAMAT